MNELIVVGFNGTYRAAEVLTELQTLDADWVIQLRDAVAVYRTYDGKLRLDQSVNPTKKEGAAWGGLLGGMLGALLAAPLTMGASTAVAAGVVGASAVTLGATGALIGAEDTAYWQDSFGISEDFVKQVGGMVQPGQSAIFFLANVSDPESVGERFRGYGGKVLRTSLPAEKAEKLQKVLANQAHSNR